MFYLMYYRTYNVTIMFFDKAKWWCRISHKLTKPIFSNTVNHYNDGGDYMIHLHTDNNFQC